MLLLATISQAQKISVSLDFRSTAISNALMDNWQTYRGLKEGRTELNPLTGWFINHNDPDLVLAVSLVSVAGFDYWIQTQPKKDQNWYYGIWAALHIFAVESNRQKGLHGFPILIPIIKIKW